MSELIIFGFENQQVRFVGTPDQPEWVAQDVGTILELQNIRQLLTKVIQNIYRINLPISHMRELKLKLSSNIIVIGI